jgi:hypothetical protein
VRPLRRRTISSQRFTARRGELISARRAHGNNIERTTA